MKKTILASAIAAASLSGAAMAAEHESNMPTVYGNIQYAVDYTHVENAAGNSQSGLEHFDNGTTLGMAHDHEIAPGITGFMKLELDGFNADNKDNDGAGNPSLDEAYIGAKGESFGQVWIGSDDSIYESSVDEIGEYYEIGSSISNDYDTGEGDMVQYLSPSFGGLTLGAAVQVNGEKDATNGDKSFPYQLAAMYEVDALELAFAVDSNDGAGNDENSYGLRASYSLENLRLTGQFETRKDVADTFGAMAAYTLGANQFAVSYQLRDEDSGDKNDEIVIQALHNLSDNMYVYAEGYASNADSDRDYGVGSVAGAGEYLGDERATLAVGAVYHF